MIIIILYTLFIIASAYVDAEHINDKDYIEDHKSRFLLRFVVALGFSYDKNMIYYFDFISLIIFLILFVSIFDSLLNIMRGKGFFYLGSVAKWDLFWKKHKSVYIFMRIFILILLIILICYYETNK